MVNKENIQAQIAKYLSGNIDQEEQVALMAWVEANEENQYYFDELIELWSLADEYEEHFEADLEASWTALDEKLLSKEEAIIKKMDPPQRTRVFPVLRVAAAITFLVVAGWWWSRQSVTEPIITATLEGEKKEIVLPDGSTIWLNEHSTLSYDEAFRERTVTLLGEAFFDVERMEDSPFKIRCGNTITTVLGTSFNIRGYEAEAKVEVTVKTGKVKFEEQEKEEEVLLEAGNAAVFSEEKEAIETVDDASVNVFSWQTEELTYQDDPLRDVIRELEKYFGVQFEIENPAILNCPLKGTYPGESRLKDILMVFEYSLDIEVEEIDGVYVLKGVGCEE